MALGVYREARASAYTKFQVALVEAFGHAIVDEKGGTVSDEFYFGPAAALSTALS